MTFLKKLFGAKEEPKTRVRQKEMEAKAASARS